MTFHTSQPGAQDRPLQQERSHGKLADLLDVEFERRFAPLLVRWLYVGSLVLIAAVTVFGLLMSWWLASWAGWGLWMGVPISIAGGLVWALGVRLVCEQLIRWTGPEPRRADSSAPSGGHPLGRRPTLGEAGQALWVQVELPTGRTTCTHRAWSAWFCLGRRWRGGPDIHPDPPGRLAPTEGHPRARGPRRRHIAPLPADPWQIECVQDRLQRS